jgi:MSHA biogenesis protein MshL
MKIRFYSIFFLSLLLAVGCASPPKGERIKLPSQIVEPSKPQPPPEEKLKEIVVPQREEAKKVPEKLYSFFARDASIQDVLLAFSRESDLNVIINPELTGKVTIDLKRVTLKEALNAILTPLGWTYQIDGNLIKIMRPQMETRFFTLNYMATRRSGRREVYASTGGGLQSGLAAGLQTGLATGLQSGLATGVASGQVTGTGAGGYAARTGYSDLISVDETDLWREIHRGLETLIFGLAEMKEAGPGKDQETWTRMDEKGKKLIINKSTGIIMVTDYPSNLNKVASYIETIEGSSQRQVSIQAKILEVTLSDQHQEGINWAVIQGLPRSTNLSWGLTDKAGTTGYPGWSTSTTSGTTTGTGTSTTIATPGVFKIKPFGGIFAIGGLGNDVVLSDIMQAISQQGDVKVLSSPSISTLNNQKAIIRVGNQDVFFITGAVATQTIVTQTIEPRTIDIGIILDVTPQIAEDGAILMNIHPSITEKTGEKLSPDGKTTFPLMSVRETDTTVRVRDGETIIIAGLMQEKKNASYTDVPVLGSIPLFGGLFRYKTETKTNAELVIMITPTLQVGKRVEDLTNK